MKLAPGTGWANAALATLATIATIAVLATLPALAEEAARPTLAQTGPAVEDPAAPLGKAAAIGNAGEWAWVEEGALLRREPGIASGALARIEVRVQLEVLERREDWVRVRHGSLVGWLSTGGVSALENPSASFAAGSARLLARAREVFGLRAHPESFGEFVLYTDVEDPEMIEFLARTSRHLRPAYEKRFGLQAKSSEPETILLFASEADYRAFALESLDDQGSRITDLRGHSTPGTAVLFAGDHPNEAVAAVLVHELAHLLNRRVFADPIPPWLEEGLANDLGFCRIDARGRLRFGTLGGRAVVIEQPEYDPGGFLRTDRGVHLTGPVASLRTAQQIWGSPDTPFPTLLTVLDWSEFTQPQHRNLHYAASAFLIRYLLDSGSGSKGDRLATGFRSFLRSVAEGGPAGSLALVESLSLASSQALDADFERWLEAQ